MADDDMSSYGLHPAIHEELVRCHNPALDTSVAGTQRRISRRVRESVEAGHHEAALTLSA
ncbi:MAG TPA: hypothetical protein VMW62_19255 [Chloroflexota bacterium]|nr:hypothetical protein [Chloroflexota bacterium]